MYDVNQYSKFYASDISIEYLHVILIFTIYDIANYYNIQIHWAEHVS